MGRDIRAEHNAHRAKSVIYRYITQIAALLAIVLIQLPARQVAFADSPTPPPSSYPAPSACADVRNCPTPEEPNPPLVDPIWWNEHKINQVNADTFATASDLLTNPYNTCGPATLTLVINYIYHLRDPGTAPQVTADQVMRTAREMGYYEPPDDDGLLGAEDLRTIASKFGLTQYFPKHKDVFLTFDELLAEIKKGFPAITGMRYAYDAQTGEYLPSEDPALAMNHYVVVFGTTDAGDLLWVLNTHPGRGRSQDTDVSLRLMTFDQFRASWSKTIDGAVQNYGVGIFLR